MSRFLVILLVLTVIFVGLTVQFSLDKRGAAWFMRTNWRPPSKRYIQVSDDNKNPSGLTAYDQYLLY
ncbi:unnamed protein product [Caenorhabditis angaria]|uniref:Uncharacterized protein n=1 Tax=Caenorhabditis angaria TaxID=860376 RepID=A0A9P1IVX1_9PELO|nr:unnamed protein product [Caenorhabditis angaria]